MPSNPRQNPNPSCWGSCWAEGTGVSPVRVLGQQGAEWGCAQQEAGVRASVGTSKLFGTAQWDCISPPCSNRPVSRRLFQLLGITLKSSCSFPNDSGVCCDAQVSLRAAVPALRQCGSRCAVNDLSGYGGYLVSHPKAQNVHSKLKRYLQKAYCREYGLGLI